VEKGPERNTKKTPHANEWREEGGELVDIVLIRACCHKHQLTRNHRNGSSSSKL